MRNQCVSRPCRLRNERHGGARAGDKTGPRPEGSASPVELFIVVGAPPRFEVKAVDHVRGWREVSAVGLLNEALPYQQLDAVAIGCWESVKPVFAAGAVDDAEQDECHCGFEGCPSAVGSVEFPPLLDIESAQAWTQCVAVPVDASEPLSGWPEALLQGEQRSFEPS